MVLVLCTNFGTHITWYFKSAQFWFWCYAPTLVHKWHNTLNQHSFGFGELHQLWYTHNMILLNQQSSLNQHTSGNFNIHFLEILLGNIAQNSFHLNHTLLHVCILAFENENNTFSMNSLEVILVLSIILNTELKFLSNFIKHVLFFFRNKGGDTIELISDQNCLC